MSAPLLMICGDPKTIAAAKNAIVEVLKAAGTEATSVAAMSCLADLARAPSNTTIHSCTFTGAPAKSKKK